MNLIFTRKHTLLVKGVAILFMIVHHLFAFPERLNYSYISIFNIEKHIAMFGKICVSMFLFISGFGTYHSLKDNILYNLKKCINKLKRMYINYWIIFFIFIPMGFFLFNIEFSMPEFILNFLGIKSTYNHEWWFFRIYILLLLTSIIIIHKISNNKIIAFIEIFGGYILGKILNKFLLNIGVTDIYFINIIIDLLTWSPCFYIGVYYAKFNIFNLLSENIAKCKLDRKIVYIAVSLLIVFMRELIQANPLEDSIITPILIMCIINIFYNTKLCDYLIYLGKHSSNIWLVHTFFCYYYFQKFVFWPKISLLIIILVTMLSLVTSYLVNFIMNLRQIGKVNLLQDNPRRVCEK